MPPDFGQRPPPAAKEPAKGSLEAQALLSGSKQPWQPPSLEKTHLPDKVHRAPGAVATPRFTTCILGDFSCCTPVFYAILVILHTCIFRDARARAKNETRKKREQSRKNREKSRNYQRCTTARASLALATLALARASRKIQVRSD